MSTKSKTQVHSKFKVFAGDLAPDHSLGKLADEVAAFGSKHAAKSIGVEYLEGAKKLIVTIGYSDDEDAYPVELKSVSLGKSKFDNDGLASLEAKMAKAAAGVGDVICHELYITEDHDFLMVFMIRK